MMVTEKRLIDANGYDAILKNREETLIAYYGSLSGAIKGCRALLDEQPIVDAVEVVRCKDCKHTRKKNGHEQFMYNENVCICTKEDIWGINKNEPVWCDGFCSYGERKKGND